MHQPMNGRALALQVADVLRICRDLDGDELVVPNMMARPPHLAKGSAADFRVEEVFGDSLVLSRHEILFTTETRRTRSRKTVRIHSSLCPPCLRGEPIAGQTFSAIQSQVNRL